MEQEPFYILLWPMALVPGALPGCRRAGPLSLCFLQGFSLLPASASLPLHHGIGGSAGQRAPGGRGGQFCERTLIFDVCVCVWGPCGPGSGHLLRADIVLTFTGRRGAWVTLELALFTGALLLLVQLQHCCVSTAALPHGATLCCLAVQSGTPLAAALWQRHCPSRPLCSRLPLKLPSRILVRTNAGALFIHLDLASASNTVSRSRTVPLVQLRKLPSTLLQHLF